MGIFLARLQLNSMLDDSEGGGVLCRPYKMYPALGHVATIPTDPVRPDPAIQQSSPTLAFYYPTG